MGKRKREAQGRGATPKRSPLVTERHWAGEECHRERNDNVSAGGPQCQCCRAPSPNALALGAPSLARCAGADCFHGLEVRGERTSSLKGLYCRAPSPKAVPLSMSGDWAWLSHACCDLPSRALALLLLDEKQDVTPRPTADAQPVMALPTLLPLDGAERMFMGANDANKSIKILGRSRMFTSAPVVPVFIIEKGVTILARIM